MTHVRKVPLALLAALTMVGCGPDLASVDQVSRRQHEAGLGAGTKYTLWIHGRTNSAEIGNYDDFANWGPSDVPAGINKRAVNWDGQSHVADQTGVLQNALDCFCTGNNWCYLATYSAGDLLTGYTLDLFGASQRNTKVARPNENGVCGDADGSTQTGWNILWVAAAAGAGGGSELADAGKWTGEPLVEDLVTTTARALYNHNNTAGVTFYMFAGANGLLYASLLPGQDDGVVAYHSSGAVAGPAGTGFCNPGDWWCNDLTMGTAPTENRRAKWANHSVRFRDDREEHSHFIGGTWGGVVSEVRKMVATQAH